MDEKKYLIYMIKQFIYVLRYIAKSLKDIKNGKDFERLANHVQHEFDLYNAQLKDILGDGNDGGTNQL